MKHNSIIIFEDESSLGINTVPIASFIAIRRVVGKFGAKPILVTKLANILADGSFELTALSTIRDFLDQEELYHGFIIDSESQLEKIVSVNGEDAWRLLDRDAINYSPGDNSIDFSFSNYPTAGAQGDHSFAIGENTLAKEKYSFTSGVYTKALGLASVAFGKSTEASGLASVAFGNDTEASGFASVAFGHESKAFGEASFAVGEGNEARGKCSFVVGRDNTAIEKYSFISGLGSRAGMVAGAAFGQWGTSSILGSANIFEVGFGENDFKRDNIFEIDTCVQAGPGSILAGAELRAPLTLRENIVRPTALTTKEFVDWEVNHLQLGNMEDVTAIPEKSDLKEYRGNYPYMFGDIIKAPNGNMYKCTQEYVSFAEIFSPIINFGGTQADFNEPNEFAHWEKIDSGSAAENHLLVYKPINGKLNTGRWENVEDLDMGYYVNA